MMTRKLLILSSLVALVGSSLVVSAQSQTPAKPTPAAPTKPAAKPAAAKPATSPNDELIKLATAGMGEDILLATVAKTDKSKYDTSADALLKLKTAGISQKVIGAILGVTPALASPSAPPPSAQPAPPPAPNPSAAANMDASPVSEIGVYYREGDRWADLLPEVVNWKTGGVLKHLASAGVIKGDVNGLINGATSKTLLRAPLQFLVYTAEGVAITEYQLLKLRQNGNTREFRTVTGGVMHAEGGATRDLIPFESNKIASRTHMLVLPTLTAGDYGILSPGSATSSSASAQLGKIYSFRIQ